MSLKDSLDLTEKIFSIGASFIGIVAGLFAFAIWLDVKGDGAEVITSADDPATEPTGWIYLGTYRDDQLIGKIIDSTARPRQSEDIVLAMDVNKRDGAPRFPLYRLGERTGTFETGKCLQVKETHTTLFNERVWARVSPCAD